VRLAKSEVILAIDPGQKEAGVVVFDGERVIYSNSEMPNTVLVKKLAGPWAGEAAGLSCLAIEMVGGGA